MPESGRVLDRGLLQRQHASPALGLGQGPRRRAGVRCAVAQRAGQAGFVLPSAHQLAQRLQAMQRPKHRVRLEPDAGRRDVQGVRLADVRARPAAAVPDADVQAEDVVLVVVPVRAVGAGVQRGAGARLERRSADPRSVAGQSRSGGAAQSHLGCRRQLLQEPVPQKLGGKEPWEPRSSHACRRQECVRGNQRTWACCGGPPPSPPPSAPSAICWMVGAPRPGAADITRQPTPGLAHLSMPRRIMCFDPPLNVMSRQLASNQSHRWPGAWRCRRGGVGHQWLGRPQPPGADLGGPPFTPPIPRKTHMPKSHLVQGLRPETGRDTLMHGEQQEQGQYGQIHGVGRDPHPCKARGPAPNTTTMPTINTTTLLGVAAVLRRA